MKLKPSQIINNRYEIIEQIGVGGTANVYCANDIKLERKVTFKVLKEEFIDEEFIKKFNKEAMAAAKLNHLNIANVYDVGNDGNIHYIVMEYIDGYTLKDIIKIKAPFTNEEVLGISIQIANALAVAHSAGIVHRDVKPENILITKEGSAKVTDFGIARVTSSNTITIDNMGSVHYFSPEQARGSYTDFKSDIYSLGIVMFEMATGKQPFDGEGVVQLAMKHINDPLPSIFELNSNVSSNLEKIILKCTQKNSNNRYNSTEALIEDLKNAIFNENDQIKTEQDFIDSQTVVINQQDIDMINNLAENSNKNLNKFNTSKIFPSFSKNKFEQNIVPIAILSGLSIAIIITSFLVFWVLSDKNSEVPDFVGKTFEQAVEIAKKREIYIRNTAEEFSDIIEEGKIISQSVESGINIKKGDTIDVTMSLGTGKFEIEDFTGLDISEVYNKVQELNISLREEYINDENIKRGKVIRQLPRAGKTMKPNDELTLYISKGTEESLVIVPNLIGLSEDEARTTLESVHLSVGRISKSESDTVEEGNVISQSINYGNEVEEGKAISLVISKGKKETSTTTTKETTTNTEISSEITTIIKQENTENIPMLKEAYLTIAPNIAEINTDFVEVKVIKILNGEQTEIYIRNHSKQDFPLKINVKGSEPTEFKLFVDGKLIATENKFN